MKVFGNECEKYTRWNCWVNYKNKNLILFYVILVLYGLNSVKKANREVKVYYNFFLLALESGYLVCRAYLVNCFFFSSLQIIHSGDGMHELFLFVFIRVFFLLLLCIFLHFIFSRDGFFVDGTILLDIFVRTNRMTTHHKVMAHKVMPSVESGLN